MTKAEEFICECTRSCSNELTGGGYHEWVTPEQALKAVEIAIEEIAHTKEEASQALKSLQQTNRTMKQGTTERERICRRIAEIRKKNGVTQEQLAKASGLTQSNIARIESGKNCIGIDLLVLLAGKLDARVEIVEN